MKRSLNSIHCLWVMAALVASAPRAEAQSVLFDFDSAPLHSSLPLNLTVGGITAQLSATGQGFSVQPANTLGFTPAGFSGYCLYPNSVYAADLLVSFSKTMMSFSILYAPEEYACDSSATLRVTAYLNNVQVGAATTNAQPGTWPSETLELACPRGFDRVVVHYDQPPITGGDWGPIFMADNMTVTPLPPPIMIENPTVLSNGSFQFSFAYTPNMACTIYGTTNLSLAFSNWTALGNALEITPGDYQFSDPRATSNPCYFYRVSTP